MALKELVEEAFRNALENEVNFLDWSDEEIAVDMLDYDADIQESGATVEEVQAEVKAYREKTNG